MAKAWFRSELMEYASLLVHEGNAHNVLCHIGEIGAMQFIDLNPDLLPFQRRFVNNIKRCDDADRKINFMKNQIDEIGIRKPTKKLVSSKNSSEMKNVITLESIEDELESSEQHLTELLNSNKILIDQYIQKYEYHEVLQKASTFYGLEMQLQDDFVTSPVPGFSLEMKNIESAKQNEDELRFQTIYGVINLDDTSRLERTLFRATRGNCYMRFFDFDSQLDHLQKNPTPKAVFMIFFNSQLISKKITKICDAFSARLFQVPNIFDSKAIKEKLVDNTKELTESNQLIQKNFEMRYELCYQISRQVDEWHDLVMKEKAIYYTLNQFKVNGSGMLQGEGWVIASKVPSIHQLLSSTNRNGDTDIAVLDIARGNQLTPPTHFEINEFTQAFQDFVNTYGVPRYQELNPAVLTSATFPFLFGLMYGDIGHGLCLFIAGIFLIMSYEKNRTSPTNEILVGLYNGRYMIALMGFCALYVGFVYNDCFSIGLNLFSSRWVWGAEPASGSVANSTCSDPSECVYPFGCDPIWHLSSNELEFFNSLKMKTSVIFGISQMSVGIIMKGFNTLYFKQTLEFVFEFIPMMIFDLALFGYMVLLIFIKWGINWDKRMLLATCIDGYVYDSTVACTSTSTVEEMCPLDYGGGGGDGCQPPNLVTTLINIALSPGSVEDPMFKGQATLQTGLLLIAFLAVPVLLCGKPISLKCKSRQKKATSILSAHPMTELIHDKDHAVEKHSHEDDHSFGEIMIHQSIETIEFVLGMVSNTASYLRLWALSLAHSELAKVFWEKAMVSTIQMGSPITILVGYAIFAAVTTGVLLLMDVLECFLHALRLHWVEFQNKFYKADGIKFQPLHFKSILQK